MSVKLLAVSGGIDSMVMMDLVARSLPGEDFLVVTVDHGTRESSAADAEFVRRVTAEKYGMRCEVVRLALGEGASEAEARAARYAAMTEVGERASGGVLGEGFEIWTAQHLDDLVESVAINLLRGTGWRGLAAMGRAGVRRPFLEVDLAGLGGAVDKKWVLGYAAERGVVWREDPTNQSDDYLRNRLRPGVRAMSLAEKLRIYDLWRRQAELRKAIEKSVVIFTTLSELPREMFLETDDAVADEILRGWLLDKGVSTTRPQRKDLMEALRTYENGKYFNLPGDRLLRIGREIKF